MENNPYAPPRTMPEPASEFQAGLVWREGGLLYIRNGAALPNRCFVTGQVTSFSVSIKQFWQPTWIYFLVIPAIVPYLIASPIVGRYVEIDAPLAEPLLQRHRRICRLGFRLLVAGLVSVTLGFEDLLLPPARMEILALEAVGVLLIAAGLVLGSREPLRLNIINFTGELLVLGDVHPDCLDAVPNAPEL